MKLLTSVFLIFFVVAANAENDDIDWSRVLPRQEIPGFWDDKPMFKAMFKNGQTGGRSGRIIGGAVVTPHAHPYQACLLSVFSTGTGICSGTLVNVRTIMSAAHCPQGSTSTQVILGAHQFTTVESSQQRLTVLPDGYRIHESFVSTTLFNDISLLILPSAVTLNQFVALTVLPTNFANENFAGNVATLSGWGRTSDDSLLMSQMLRSTTQTVITNEVCRRTYTVLIRDSTLCIAGTGGRGACGGDSGGPLTVQRSGQTIQIGIVSFINSAGCETGTPGGFARVTSFLDWIATNTQN